MLNDTRSSIEVSSPEKEVHVSALLKLLEKLQLGKWQNPL